VTRRRQRLIVGGLCLLLLLAGPWVVGAQPRADDLDARIAAALSAIYNLDRDEALTAARQAVAMAPQASRAHRTLATILWLDALYARGALSVDNYLGGLTKSRSDLPKPPAALDTEFRHELDVAMSLARAQLDAHPDDVAAMHDLGTAYALQASYTASVEGRVMAAFSTARRAFNLEEEVLDRDPGRLEAGTIIGTYRYTVSSLGLASRMVAYLAGFGGGKARGIAMIESASHTGPARTEARTALVLIYSREGRHLEAFHLLGDLAAEYPRNRLFVLEEGAAAIRAGKAGEAEAILTRGLAAFDRDSRPKLPGERAMWLYKLGASKISLNHPAEARTDLEAAMRSSPIEWVRGRLNLELGKVADLTGQRQEALARYRAAREIGERTNDPIGAADAGKFMQRPFAMPTG
jgi:hypothetical protein